MTERTVSTRELCELRSISHRTLSRRIKAGVYRLGVHFIDVRDPNSLRATYRWFLSEFDALHSGKSRRNSRRCA